MFIGVEFHDHQTSGSVDLSQLSRGLLVFPTGQGKSLTSLRAYHLTGRTRLIALVPKNAITSWEDDLSTYVTVPWSLFPSDRWEESEIVVVPHSKLDKFKRASRASFFDDAVVVIDEVDAFQNPTTSLYEYGWHFSTLAPAVWGLTATPIHSDLRNTYSFVDLVFKGNSPFGTFKRFEKRFIKYERKMIYIKGGGGAKRPVNEICGYKNLPELRKMMAPFTLTSPTVADLRFRYAFTEFSAAEEAAYKKGASDILKTHAAAAYLSQLQKFTDGVYYDGRSSKELLFDKILSEVVPRNNPFIIYVEYHASRHVIQDILKDHGVKIHQITGRIDTHIRRRVKDAIKDGGRQCVLMTRAGIRGINLQFCETTIMYDTPSDIKNLIQLFGRQCRIGSPFKRWYAIFMGVRGTIDHYKLAYVHAHADLVNALVEGTAVLPKTTTTVTKKDVMKMRRSLLWKTSKKELPELPVQDFCL